MLYFTKNLLTATVAATTLIGSTSVFAYSYATSITITAPKGSSAETAAKDKTKPAGITFTPCDSSSSTNANLDALNFSVKFDAGKLRNEIGDVYIVFQYLGKGSIARNRYIAFGRVPNDSTTNTPGVLKLTSASTAVMLDTNLATEISLGSNGPYLAKADNLGSGAMTESLLGGNLTLNDLYKGIWSITSIIAKPGLALSGMTIGVDKFSFTDRSTWAAFDTAAFFLGTPFDIDTTPQTVGGDFQTLDALCQ